MPLADEYSTVVNAPPTDVWSALTDTASMKKWMGEAEFGLDIGTDWRVGAPIVIKGFHHIHFENKGTVLQFEPPSILRYTHLSSTSRLHDQAANYSTIEFKLVPAADLSTSLTVKISGSPNEVIHKHLALYWRTTIQILKRFVESSR